MDRYKLDGFFEFLSEEYKKRPGHLLPVNNPEDFYRRRDEKRNALKRILGLDKLEALKVPLNVTRHETLKLKDEPGITVERLGMDILPSLTMPVYIVRSAGGNSAAGKTPTTGSASAAKMIPPAGSAAAAENTPPSRKAVLYCHGHGEGGVADCFARKGQYHKNLPLALAMRGYDVFTFEPAAFGDFTVENYKAEDGGNPCYPLTTRLLMYGISTAGLRVFQAERAAEYMTEVCGIKEFAAAGISGGGQVCTLYGALYDGAYANIISCYPNLFETSIMAMHHCVDNFVPGIFDIGNIPDIIAMNAPKKLLLQSGVNDPIFPIEGSKEAYARVKQAYDALGITDSLTADFTDGGHEFNVSLIDWLDKL